MRTGMILMLFGFLGSVLAERTGPFVVAKETDLKGYNKFSVVGTREFNELTYEYKYKSAIFPALINWYERKWAADPEKKNQRCPARLCNRPALVRMKVFPTEVAAVNEAQKNTKNEEIRQRRIKEKTGR